MNIRNAKHNMHGTIDCEIEDAQFGWIPFTASPDDPEETGRAIYAAAIAGELGAIEAYIPPSDAEILAEKRASATLSRREFYQALITEGLYDAVIAMEADPATPLEIRIDLKEASYFERMYPALVTKAGEMGVTDNQLDAIFGIV